MWLAALFALQLQLITDTSGSLHPDDSEYSHALFQLPSTIFRGNSYISFNKLDAALSRPLGPHFIISTWIVASSGDAVIGAVVDSAPVTQDSGQMTRSPYLRKLEFKLYLTELCSLAFEDYDEFGHVGFKTLTATSSSVCDGM